MAQGCVGGEQDLSGRPLFCAPQVTASVGVDYELPLAAGYKLGLSADGRYSSSYFVNTLENPTSKQSKFATVNGAIRLMPQGEQGMLTDLPRTIMIKASWRFDR